MKQPCIYKIESSLIKGRIYIGSASYYSSRKNRHIKDLRLNKHGNIKLQRHFNKYGESDLQFSIIEPCLPQFLVAREQYYIDKFKPFFNICQIAGSSLGRIASDETKNKMRIAQTGNKNALGHRDSDEARRKKSISFKGRKGFWKNKKLSNETKKRMSESQKRIGNKPPSWLNKNHSKETRKKLSEIAKKREYDRKRLAQSSLQLYQIAI